LYLLDSVGLDAVCGRRADLGGKTVKGGTERMRQNRKYGIGPIKPLGREKADLRRLKGVSVL
jgi:hypothetical protein